VAWLLAACETCDRDGCDALSTRAGQATGQTRVAGVVASESDVVGNGCQECGFAEAQVRAWPRSTEVTSEEDARPVAMGAPAASGSAGKDGRYSLALEAGEYLVCFNLSCFNADVVAGRTTTINVRLINGVSSGYVGSPDTDELSRVDAVFLPSDL
jgi:hypothetical protein